MKSKTLTWPKLNYSRSISAYLIGILSGIRVNDNAEEIPFYLLGAVCISIVATLIITIKSDTESHDWHSAFKEGITYFIRYIMTLLATFLLTVLLAKFVFPLF